jgi:hypothetical protein
VGVGLGRSVKDLNKAVLPNLDNLNSHFHRNMEGEGQRDKVSLQKNLLELIMYLIQSIK